MDERVEVALALMDRECNRRLTVAEIAGRLGLSPSGFQHLFRAQTGRSFRAQLREIRLLKARGLVADGTLSVKEVASLSGYASVPTFSRNFKQRFGEAPFQYLRRKSG